MLALDITSYTYYTGMQYLFQPMELWAGVIKSFVFGVIIFVLGYYHGVNAGSGARGVGMATMNVVVASCLMILIADFALAAILFLAASRIIMPNVEINADDVMIQLVRLKKSFGKQAVLLDVNLDIRRG